MVEATFKAKHFQLVEATGNEVVLTFICPDKQATKELFDAMKKELERGELNLHFASENVQVML